MDYALPETRGFRVGFIKMGRVVISAQFGEGCNGAFVERSRELRCIPELKALKWLQAVLCRTSFRHASVRTVFSDQAGVAACGDPGLMLPARHTISL